MFFKKIKYFKIIIINILYKYMVPHIKIYNLNSNLKDIIIIIFYIFK